MHNAPCAAPALQERGTSVPHGGANQGGSSGEGHPAWGHPHGDPPESGCSCCPLPPFPSCSQRVARHPAIPLAWRYVSVAKSNSTSLPKRFTQQDRVVREGNAAVSPLRFFQPASTEPQPQVNPKHQHEALRSICNTPAGFFPHRQRVKQ